MLSLLTLLLVAAPARVVSMAPALTDLVIELGASDRLVGVSRFDDAPALQRLPRVGGYLDPNLEAVVRLQPDLVVALDGVSFAGPLKAMQQAKLRVLALRTDTLDDLHASLVALGTALGVAARADAVWNELTALRAQVRAQSAGRPRIRCAVAVGLRPLVLAGRGSYLEPLLEDAGGENVAPSDLAWPTSSVEQLVAAKPQVLIDGTGAEQDEASGRVLKLLEAQGARVVHPSADLFRPGPRAIRALPELARLIQGGPSADPVR
jgi:iron complex transport system substrate-binding protein